MTKSEVIEYLRIPEISKAKNYDNVIDNLIRMHDLPCIHISREPLFPLGRVQRWVEEKVDKEKLK